MDTQLVPITANRAVNNQSMIVYHGTGGWALSGFLESVPEKRPRGHLRGKAAFCTTITFSVAALFAFRKTTIDDFISGIESGIVLEFVLIGKDEIDFRMVRDYRTPQAEDEIAVFNVSCLQLVAVWRSTHGKWSREEIENIKAANNGVSKSLMRSRQQPRQPHNYHD